ncbi:DNRLRE domain-containing protein [Streptomyces sp. CC210A]|uniref:DNRLRE domain-containing protein n=1 Tax=Streptomyces sp. CC210A TaxID=2898184 RepID=UPI001F351C32|nr:DNRLRE domain-containing protein [Streptomyces sp. CC210A]
MAISLMEGVATAAPSDENNEKPTAAAAVKEAADLASAQVAARLSGRRVEALSERTESTTTWANPDGSVTLDAASGPIRFRDEATGKWRDIDIDLLKTSSGEVVAQAHPLGLKLAGKTPTAQAAKVKASGAAGEAETTPVPLVTLAAGDDRAMILSWRGALPEPAVSGTTARYPNALTSTDLIIESTRTGFEQFLELKDRSAIAANGSVTLTLDAKGIKARANADRSVTFLDAESGKQVGVLPAPVMWDAYVDPKSGEHTHRADVGLKVTQRGSAVDLTLTPDAKFLADPVTKFPVTVDPAVNIGTGFDTFVQQGYATDVSAQTELKLGNNGSGQVARSFLAFPMSKITGKQILGAKLNLWNFHSWSCNARSWEVWDTGTASTSTRWTAQPSWNRKWATTTATKGYSSSCADGWVSQDITSLAAAWASNGNATNTLGIRATDETDSYGWKRFNSGNAASNTPYLSVTYNTKPGAATPVSPLSGTATNDTTPTITGKATDADGNTVQLTYEIWTSTGTTALQTGKSAYVASGANASWTPTTALAQGSYKWRAAVYDGSAWNGTWSAWQTFTVDTTAPATTQIASGDFPANTWSGTPDANGNFSGSFTFTPPTSDVKTVEYKLDAGAWVSAATTGTAVSKTLTFPAGKHSVSARTRDAAGNISAETSHVFYAGSGAALLSPGRGDRPARRVGLSAEGQSSYTGVTYQYRRGETDTWKNVPLADVRQASDGAAVSGWPVATVDGKPAGLTWNVTDTLTEDGPIEVRAAFTDGTTSAYSPVNTITVDRNAGTAPSEEAGPGSVNLLTGDYTLSATDASLFGLAVSRTASSRRPDAGAKQDGQAPIFGPQWTSGTAAELTESDWAYLKKTSATSVALVDSEGEELGFTATTGGGWQPEPGAEDFTLTGSLTGSFTLEDTEGTFTVFTKPAAAATSWQVASSTLDGLAQSTTTVISETVTVDGKTLARPKRIIAPTSAASATTCTATPSTKGCRALEFVYATATTATDSAFGDVAGQVKEILAWSTEPGASAATSKSVQKYAYDGSGRLRETWNPQISPALTTAYDYDAAGRVTGLTPPGELPWSFTYGKAGNAATAGDGMLLKANRAGLRQGTKDAESGTASTSIVYDVPLTGDKAPYKMSATDVQAWGQSDAPTDATAVLPADAPPAANAGDALAAGDYRRASITYTNASGREVNSASPGGHISVTEYDHHGNTVRELTASNRALALGTTAAEQATLTDLGIAGLSTQDRADLLATRSVFDAKGIRELEVFGPLRRVTLTGSGESAAARSWTVNEYDAGRPTDGTAKVENQVTKVTTGAQVLGTTTMADARVTQTVYDWLKGVPVKTIKDPTGLNITETSEYDDQGRVTKQLLPGATGTDAGTRVTTYWSATGTGTCAGRPEWADQVCSTGPAGAISGGGTNPTGLPVTTTEYDWWGNPTKVTETANGVTRTTVNTYDGAGRLTKTATTGELGQAVPEAMTEYDPATGQAVKTVSPTGGTITKEYDKLGRQVSYTDADGGVTTTEYDLLNRPVKTTDSVPSTVTYTYDTAVEPRGMITATTDSIAGTFAVTYDADGSISTEKLPGGYTLKVEKETTGATTSRVYTRDSDGQTVVADTVEESIHGQVTAHSGWSAQSYTYDATGRLIGVNDTVGDVCTKRTYAFDKRTNRTSLTTVEGASGATCPTTGGTTTTHTYDSADRLVDSGYLYDAFGRTTSLPGSQINYYANDLLYQQTANGQRQTWQLDATHRFRSWTVETGSGTTWTQTASKLNHYDGEGDNPRWIVEDTATGALIRNVESASGDLAATTAKTGDTVLQLTNIHGDVALQLPLTGGEAPVALDSDEYGNPRAGQPATRYGWLGAKQRSAETLTGLTLMGVRFYNPVTGRFLSIDPVHGGGDNRYGYPGDPINQYDLDGKSWKRRVSPVVRLGWHYLNRSHSRYRSWRHRQEARVIGVYSAYVGARYLGYRCRVRYGMRVCSGGLGLHSRGGTTLGTTFFTSNRNPSPSLMRHERRHKAQWKRYGLRFGYMYLRAGVNPCRNRWERRAGYRDGGYRC